MSAQRPLTAEGSRRQPVQQANGRAVWGRGAVGVPARQRRRRVEVVVRPARAVIDDQTEGGQVGPTLQPPGVAATSRGRLLHPGFSLGRRCGVGWLTLGGHRQAPFKVRTGRSGPPAARTPTTVSHGAPAEGG
jgi:hypothetical protein